MGNAIVTLFCVALILVAGLLIGQASLSSVSLTSDSWKRMGDRTSEIGGTNIQIKSVTQSPPNVNATVKNTGRVALADFSYWEVIGQYYSGVGNYYIRRFLYTTSSNPGNNEWTVSGIYKDAGTLTPEVFEPGILNPTEELIIKIKLSPSGSQSATNWLIIATPNGLSASAMFP